MKLIWKRKIMWREDNGKLYIHPILAFASIIAAIPLSWLLCNLIAGI